MAIPSANVLGNPNVTEGNFQIALEQLRESVLGSGKAYDSANTYSQYDTCVHSGVSYYSKINSNTGNTPAIGTNWGLESELIKLIASPTTNAIPKINADGTIGNSNIINDANGNLGIGVIPSSSLALYKTLEVNGAMLTGHNSRTNAELYSNAYLDSSAVARYITNSNATYLSMYQGGYAWFTAPSGTAGNAITWTNAMTLDASGNLLLQSGTGGLGYGTGAGGTVTQLTSKSTAVTLNKPTGIITMNNAALAAGASVFFEVNNSLVATSDNIVLTMGGATINTNYTAFPTFSTSNGIFYIIVKNISAGSLSEALAINFTIIRGATA